MDEVPLCVFNVYVSFPVHTFHGMVKRGAALGFGVKGLG